VLLLPRLMTGYGDAGAPTGSPAASLPLPGTPHRIRRGADLDNLIRSLENKWKIGLKLRGAEWSPKKSAGDDVADKVYGIVKRLFFSAQPALNDAIHSFEELAPRTAPREHLGLLHRTLLSKIKKDIGMPKNDPPKSLASALTGKYTLVFPYRSVDIRDLKSLTPFSSQHPIAIDKTGSQRSK
jgi:hypothetical protein